MQFANTMIPIIGIIFLTGSSSSFALLEEIKESKNLTSTTTMSTITESLQITSVGENKSGENETELANLIAPGNSSYSYHSIANQNRRNPKFGGINLPIAIPGLSDLSSSTPSTSSYMGGFPDSGGGQIMTSSGLVEGVTVALASTAALIKGGILGGLTALKVAVLPPLFIGAAIAFLIAGSAFFACNVVNCRNLIGAGTPFANFFNRIDSNNDESNAQPSYNSEGYYGYAPASSYYLNDYNTYENQIQPVYQTLEESFRKYGSFDSTSARSKSSNKKNK